MKLIFFVPFLLGYEKTKQGIQGTEEDNGMCQRPSETPCKIYG